MYALAKAIVRIGLHWYYQQITVSGAERIPRTGPVFLAANHPNALIDALVVGLVAPRRDGGRLIDVDALRQHPPRHGAIHGPRIDVPQT